ncbi:hypothetical protein D3C87_858630 [compost metagenome]
MNISDIVSQILISSIPSLKGQSEGNVRECTKSIIGLNQIRSEATEAFYIAVLEGRNELRDLMSFISNRTRDPENLKNRELRVLHKNYKPEVIIIEDNKPIRFPNPFEGFGSFGSAYSAFSSSRNPEPAFFGDHTITGFDGNQYLNPFSRIDYSRGFN